MDSPEARQDQVLQSPDASSAVLTSDKRLQPDMMDLTYLAAKAFEENRRKECLALVRVILNLDPQNKDACDMQSRIRSDLERDLHHVRSLVPSLPKHENSYAMSGLMPLAAGVRKLQGVLDIDPENEAAQALLQQIESWFAAEYSAPKEASEGESGARVGAQFLRDVPKQRFHLGMRAGMVGIVLLLVAAVTYVGEAGWLQNHTGQHLTAGFSNARQPNTANTITTLPLGTLEIAVDEGVDIFLNDQYVGAAPIAPLQLKPDLYNLRYELHQVVLGQEMVRVTPGEAGHNSMHAFLGSLEFSVLPGYKTRVQINDKPAVPTPAHVTVQPGDYRLKFIAEKYESQSLEVSIAAGQSRNVSVTLRPVVPPAASESSSPAKGTLAVSSPTAIDIFKDDAYLGSAPVSLELPVGAQTLEYRHGNLRKQVTHVIESNETTRAMITFDVDVQINAKPWADVFLDGVERKSLGQTPLNGVRVPIGSVLVFENPGFPTKEYRVTGNEKRIQIVFP